MPEPAYKRQLISTVYATPLMTPTTALGLSVRLSMFELHETGDWDIFLGPPERARAETGGADQWVLKRRECSGFARVNQVTSESLGYPLSVFNKNSTLKGKFPEPRPGFEFVTRTKISHVTFSSHNVTFQVRCDAARFRKSMFSTSKNMTIFLELGTNVTISSHRHIFFFWVRLGTNLGLKTWPGPVFQVLGSSIWARNNPECPST